MRVSVRAGYRYGWWLHRVSTASTLAEQLQVKNQNGNLPMQDE